LTLSQCAVETGVQPSTDGLYWEAVGY
jgi:hypothetical protein